MPMEYSDFENFETLKCFIYGWMGWDGMDCWDGMEYKKCPSYIFIPCEYIENVYTYLDIY